MRHACLIYREPEQIGACKSDDCAYSSQRIGEEMLQYLVEQQYAQQGIKGR